MKYPIETKTLTITSAFDGREFLSIRFQTDNSIADPEYNGLEFCLPYVRDPSQAEKLWKELAKIMTELEKYIGRNSE